MDFIIVYRITSVFLLILFYLIFLSQIPTIIFVEP